MSQSRLGSLAESVFNVAVGYTVAVAAQTLVFPLFGVYLPLSQNLQIALIFTVISLIRSYLVRRLFNEIHARYMGW